MDEALRDKFSAFLGGYPKQSYKKGEMLLFQGEAPRNAFVLVGGIVKAYNLNANGDEKPITYYGPQTTIPGSWVFGAVPSSVYYYEAFTDVTVRAVPREAYVAFVKSDADFLYWELRNYVHDEVGKTLRLNALEHSRASDKLLYTLHYLAMTHSKPAANGMTEVTLRLTHQDFANLTGLTRETTATELNKLKTKGIISYGKQAPYLIDMHKLKAVLSDQFMAELRIAP